MTRMDVLVAPGPIDPPVVIGYLTERDGEPGKFDGWLERPDRLDDDKVVSGATEAWARYKVLRAFMEDRLKEIDGTAGSLTKGRDRVVLDATTLLAGVAEDMEVTLFQHARRD